MTVNTLVVDLGFSETLNGKVGRLPNLGNALSDTPILWMLKE